MVRLADRERPIVTVQVADKEFVIRRVVTGVFRRYGQFAQDSGEAITQLADLQKQMDAPDADLESLQPRIQEMTSVAEHVASNREAMEQECIRLILEKNGYSFDWDWWIDNTDTTDRQAFIVECLNKDTKHNSKKKVDASTGQE